MLARIIILCALLLLPGCYSPMAPMVYDVLAARAASPWPNQGFEDVTPQQNPLPMQQKVYDASECVGTVNHGRCYGTIRPKLGYHQTCYGVWVNGMCHGRQF